MLRLDLPIIYAVVKPNAEMNLETLKVFCDLAETKSFSKAAEVNGITQSAVSQQVRGLELKYQVSLVERNRKACGLTPEGRTLLDAARRIVETFDALGEELRNSSTTMAGKIRIASDFSIGLHELPPKLEQFREAHPEVEVALQYMHSPEVCEAVAAGEFDFGLVAYPQARPGLKFENFAEDELAVICHPDHPFAKRTSVEISALTGENFVAFAPDAASQRFVERQLRKHQAELTTTTQFDNIETVKRAVEIKTGISLVPRNTVQAEVESGSLAAVSLKGIRLERPLALVFKLTRSRSLAVRAFLDTLRGEEFSSSGEVLAGAC